MTTPKTEVRKQHNCPTCGMTREIHNIREALDRLEAAYNVHLDEDSERSMQLADLLNGDAL